jgi:hypothetical protein
MEVSINEESNNSNNYLYENGLENITIFLFNLKRKMFIPIDF